MDESVVYITEDERIKCQKVADIFAEVFKDYKEDLVIINAGIYGFVKLQYFKFPRGFDTITSYFDSLSMFNDLWIDVLQSWLLNLAIGTPMEEMDYEDIFKCLPEEKQKEILGKKIELAEMSGIKDILV